MKKLAFLLALLMLFALALPVLAEEAPQSVPDLTEPLDYSDGANWAYYREGEGKPADLFIVCPTVDTRSYANSVDLNEKLKGKFVSALDAEKGIYADSCRLYSPYYRQMSINAYTFGDEDFAKAEKNAFLDVSAAFRYYLDNENDGRPIVLAGFSQGAQMCIELLKEFFGDTAEGRALNKKLVAVYAIGWRITDEDIKAYPQIVPAKGESDTGSVICYECEDGAVTGSIIIPEGVKTHSINPLNWKTDGTPADKSLNKGALFSEEQGVIPGFCGAQIDEARGSITVPGVSREDFPKVLDVFPDGCFHIYDNMFFYTNLKENVALRVNAYLEAQQRAQSAGWRWIAAAAAAVIVIGAAAAYAVNKNRKKA